MKNTPVARFFASDCQGRIFLCAISIGITIVITPFLLIRFPALVDFPVHLVRQYILVAFDQSTALQANYAIDWGIKPNLAMDLMIPLMARWTSVELATKVFMVLAMLSPVVGATLLSSVLGTSTRFTALISLCFVYNLALIGGFANFLMGIGMSLTGFALWLKLDLSHPVVRVLTGVCVVILNFFTHLFTLGVYLVLIFAHELGKAIADPLRIRKQFFPMMLICTMSLVLWLLKPPGPEDAHLFYGDVVTRIKVLFSPFVSLLHAVDFVLLLLTLLGFYLLFKVEKRIPIVTSMRLTLMVLVVAAMLIPQEISGGAAVAVRMPIVVIFVLIASLTTRRLSTSQTNVLMLVVLVVIFARSLQMIFIWQEYDKKFLDFVAASSHIPPGSRVIALHELTTPPNDPLMSHMVTLSVMSRCAFVPHMAKLPDQHPVAPSARTLSIDGGASVPLTPLELALGTDPVLSDEFLKKYPLKGWSKAYYLQWPAHFDYLVHVYDTGKNLPNPDPQHLAKVASSSFFTIYRVIGRPEVLPMTCSYAS